MPKPEPNPSPVDPASLRRGVDLRRHPRHACIDGGVLRVSVCPEFRGRRALLVNVSAGGIGFLVEDCLEAGTVLVFVLQGADDIELMVRLARVRHSRPHPVPADAPWLPRKSPFTRIIQGLIGASGSVAKDTAWMVGCQFDQPLSEDDVLRIVAQLKSIRV
jgi:hypothetical protein